MNLSIQQALDYVTSLADDERELARKYVRSKWIFHIHAHAAEKLGDVADVLRALAEREPVSHPPTEGEGT